MSAAKVLMVEPGTGFLRSVRVEDRAEWEARGFVLGERLAFEAAHVAADEPVTPQPSPVVPVASEPEPAPEPARGVTYPRKTQRRSVR